MLRTVAFTMLASVLLAELAFWVLNPSPRVQIIRDSEVSLLDTVGGHVIWTGYGTEKRVEQPCLELPEPKVIFVAGSSIAFGSGLEEGFFSESLQQRLDNAFPNQNYCVVNIAQPGFALGSKIGMIQKWSESFTPAMVLIELFYNDQSRFVQVGDTAYNVGHLRTDEMDFPNLFGLPATLNGVFLQYSRLYEYTTLSLARRVGRSAQEEWREWTKHELQELFRLEERLGVPFLYGVFPNLHTPLSSQAKTLSPEYKELVNALREHGTPYFRVSELLQDQRIEDIRLDECCHFNALGHEILGERIWPLVEKELTSNANR